MALKLFIGGERGSDLREIEMFADETINITSIVKDVRDVSKIYTDFSQTFTIPASGINNEIIRKFYNNEYVTTVDMRQKQYAVIEIDGIIFKKGWLKYEKTTFKKGLPSIHSVTFTGSISGLSDLIGDNLLSSLDFRQYDHETNATNTRLGVNNSTSLFNDDIIYPLITNYDVQWTAANLTTIINDDELSPTDLKPAIRTQAIIDAINTQYDLNFTYHDTVDLSRLYMWLGKLPDSDYVNGSDINHYEGPLDSITNYRPVPGNYINPTTGVIDLSKMNQYWESFKLNFNVSGTTGADFTISIWYKYRETSEWVKTGVEQSGTTGGVFQLVQVPNIAGDNNNISNSSFLKLVLTGTDGAEFNITYDFVLYLQGTNYQYFRAVKMNLPIVNQLSSVALKMPNIKVLDWLKGHIQMFNFIPVVDKDDFRTIELVPYDDWFYENQREIEITKWIDEETYIITPSIIPSDITFKYEDTDCLLGKSYRLFHGEGYGDYINEDVVWGSGEGFKVELPFSNMLWNFIPTTNIFIGQSIDYNSGSPSVSPIDDEIFFMYRDVSGATVTTGINFSGWTSPVTTYKLCNTFLNSIGTDEVQYASPNLNFKTEINYYNNKTISSQSLYGQYSKLIDSFTNVSARIYNYSAVIPMGTLSQIKLNDILLIKDREYTINKMETDTLTNVTKLELLQYFVQYDPSPSTPDNTPPQNCVLWVNINDIPTTPSDLVATLKTETSFTLSWTGSVTNNPPIIEYRVFQNGVYYGTTTGTTINITGLVPSSTATWTVTAIDSGNNYSLESVGLLVVLVQPLGLTFNDPITITDVTDLSITVSFLPGTAYLYPITNYVAYLDGVLFDNIPLGSYTYTYAGLTPETSYDLSIRVIDSNSDFDDSTTVTQITDVMLPTAPLSLTALNITQTTFDLHWIPSNAFGGNGNPIVEYEIYRNGVHSYSVTGTPPSSNIGLVGQTIGSLNLWQLIGIDDQGLRSPISVGLNVQQLSDTPPPSGTFLQLSNTNTGPGGTRTQIFSINASNIYVGDTYYVVVYSHTVSYVVQTGDGVADIILALVLAVNNTTESQWNSAGSAPAIGTNGYPPIAFTTTNANEIKLRLNYQNQFGAGVF